MPSNDLSQVMTARYFIHILNYNFVPEALLEALSSQIDGQNGSIQLIVWDDGSAPEYITGLTELQDKFDFPWVIWKRREVNRGRAAMRQKILCEHVEGWMISLDSDMIPDDDFISQMLDCLQNESFVYVGEHYYQHEKPADRFVLHWCYGKNRETQKRGRDPHHHFSTGIFAIHSALAQGLRFEQKLTNYGHEDTLFGMELRAKGVKVLRCPMKALHAGLNTFEDFMEKQLSAIHNLKLLVSEYPGYESKLVKWGRRIDQIPGLRNWMAGKAFRQMCLKKLRQNPQSLLFLDLWKLSAFLDR